MHLVPWWGWTIVAAVLAIAELAAPGTYLIWIALGAAVTAAADAAFELSLAAQLGVFAAASAVSCIAGAFVYRRLIHDRRRDTGFPLNQRNVSLIGERGIVTAAFVAGVGKVRLGDSVWLAEGPDFPEGTPVVVCSVTGTRLIVEDAGTKTAP